ncbi:hypothetical protein NP233_g12011 [Leucocoprinus birnbaumii]|uniref:Uncharacterized protein n=1 Tax=Leucocoprinus birnbaumii TaxID=56174 RepID=A0AAD5YNF3_9AGAR|nr:hypothetical protein NP233_g12011 [Leucocoprinus birnbaumii]
MLALTPDGEALAPNHYLKSMMANTLEKEPKTKVLFRVREGVPGHERYAGWEGYFVRLEGLKVVLNVTWVKAAVQHSHGSEIQIPYQGILPRPPKERADLAIICDARSASKKVRDSWSRNLAFGADLTPSEVHIYPKRELLETTITTLRVEIDHCELCVFFQRRLYIWLWHVNYTQASSYIFFSQVRLVGYLHRGLPSFKVLFTIVRKSEEKSSLGLNESQAPPPLTRLDALSSFTSSSSSSISSTMASTTIGSSSMTGTPPTSLSNSIGDVIAGFMGLAKVATEGNLRLAGPSRFEPEPVAERAGLPVRTAKGRERESVEGGSGSAASSSWIGLSPPAIITCPRIGHSYSKNSDPSKMRHRASNRIARQKFVVLYLDGPTREELDLEARIKIRTWIRRVWRKLVERCLKKGTPGYISGVIAKLDHLSPGEPKVMAPHSTVRLFDGWHREIATIHAPMPRNRRDRPFYGISRKRARNGVNFEAEYEVGMTVRVAK